MAFFLLVSLICSALAVREMEIETNAQMVNATGRGAGHPVQAPLLQHTPNRADVNL